MATIDMNIGKMYVREQREDARLTELGIGRVVEFKSQGTSELMVKFNNELVIEFVEDKEEDFLELDWRVAKLIAEWMERTGVKRLGLEKRNGLVFDVDEAKVIHNEVQKKFKTIREDNWDSFMREGD